MTLSSTSTRIWPALLARMAMRVSRSGGWMSAINPHSKRESSRSSMDASSRGGRSAEMTTWFPELCRSLKVWKKPSWVCSLPLRNWTSSISSTWTER